jgi:hypothetical protein
MVEVKSPFVLTDSGSAATVREAGKGEDCNGLVYAEGYGVSCAMRPCIPAVVLPAKYTAVRLP